MIDDETRFVCNTNDSDEMKKAIAELDAFREKETQQTAFLKKQLEALNNENTKHWAAIFKAAQLMGKIPKDYKYKDWAIQLAGPDHTQMFISPKDRQRSGLPGFLKQFFD